MTDSHNAPLVDAILIYLRRHPQAADSVDGVTRWWLDNSGTTPASADVERALAMLVAQGALRRVVLPDGTVLYACDPSTRH